MDTFKKLIGQLFPGIVTYLNMFTVYVLYSQKHNKIYIGYTSDLENRIRSHNELGTNGHTLKFRPWIILFTEVYPTKTEAIIREKQLKGGKGREHIWIIVREKSREERDHEDGFDIAR